MNRLVIHERGVSRRGRLSRPAPSPRTRTLFMLAIAAFVTVGSMGCAPRQARLAPTNIFDDAH